MDLKAEIIKKLEDKGVNVANLRIKFYKESPYQREDLNLNLQILNVGFM